VANQISYYRKEDYFLVIHQYLSELIEISAFRTRILQMENKDFNKANIILNDFEQLETFSFVEDLDNFSNLHGKISDLFFDD